jgi:hypothetical protein
VGDEGLALSADVLMASAKVKTHLVVKQHERIESLKEREQDGEEEGEVGSVRLEGLGCQ